MAITGTFQLVLYYWTNKSLEAPLCIVHKTKAWLGPGWCPVEYNQLNMFTKSVHD